MLERRKSFSVVEKLIGISIVLIIFATLLVASVGKGVAFDSRQSARSWASQMYPNERTTSVMCQTFDTDGDGYLSCSIRINEYQPIALDCPVIMSFNKECRMSRTTNR